MNRPHLALAAHVALAVATVAVHFALANTPATAGPTVGFVEDFASAGDVGGFASQALNTNPGTGGVGGGGDGFLHIARTAFAGQLGSRAEEPQYSGDWLAAGADRVRLSLKDVDGDQNLEIHFSIGNVSNMWQYDTGFIPPNGSWAEFTVDLTDSANFSHIIDFEGGMAYAGALQAVDRILIRHDKAPFAQSPDVIIGEFGVDDIKIEASLIGVAPGGPIAVRRPVQLAPPFPNPSRGRSVFAFETFDDGPVTISIIDARGRLVTNERLPGLAGRRAWAWDGLDADGRVTPAGVYRVRAYTNAGGMSRPLVRVN